MSSDWSSQITHTLQRWALRREERGQSTELDARGLVPVEVAREVLDEHRILQSGLPRYYGGPVREGAYRSEELIWGALLSLSDVDEFLERAATICWMDGPGLLEAPLLTERYGEAVRAWLLGHVRDSVLVNVPRGIRSCLYDVGNREVFEVLWRVRDCVDGNDPDPTHVSRHVVTPAEGWTFRADDLPTFCDPDREPFSLMDYTLIIPFAHQQPELVVGALVEHHQAGDARATAVLRCLLTSKYEGQRLEAADPIVEAALSSKELKALKKKPRVRLTAETILAQLDAAWSGEANTAFLSWPLFEVGLSREVDEYHALRLIAVRGTGSAWGLVFERLAGMPLHPHEPVEWQLYTYGSECELGQEHGRPYPLKRTADPGPPGIDGIVVEGRGATLTLTDAMIEQHDLRPGQSVESHGAHHRANLVLRAWLAANPGATWSNEDPKYTARKVVEKGKVILVSEAFEHVGTGPEEGGKPPSESPVFQSLARAIVARDPDLFEPGQSNLDWRLHAGPSPDAGPVDA